jgi:catalase
MAKLTTVFGAPVVDNQNIKTAGPRGPALLEDVWFLARHHAIHASKDLFGDRQEDRDVCTLFDRCRRTRCS